MKRNEYEKPAVTITEYTYKGVLLYSGLKDMGNSDVFSEDFDFDEE